MKTSFMVMAGVILVSAASFAERSQWTTGEQVKGTATYKKDPRTGLKICTHDDARFSHAYTGTTEIVIDKLSGKSAKYYSDVSLSKRDLHILVNADRVTGMPNYMAKMKRGILYFDKLNDMKSGIADQGFFFTTVADVKENTYTVICAKE